MGERGACPWRLAFDTILLAVVIMKRCLCYWVSHVQFPERCADCEKCEGCAAWRRNLQLLWYHFVTDVSTFILSIHFSVNMI